MPVHHHWSDRLGGAAGRLTASLLISGLVALLLPHGWTLLLRVLGGWCAGAGVYLSMAWRVMLTADADGTRHRCRREDSSRGIVDALLTVCTVATVGAVGLVLQDSTGPTGPHPLFGVGVPILAVVLAWLLVHTIYALHYARLYYHNDEDPTGPPAGGLDFHETDTTADGDDHTDPPDYRDFLYLSFGVACTYGVTDVDVTRKSVRRTVWKHGLLSFAFAAVVLALAVNLITNLLSKG